MPQGLEDVSKVPDLVAELLRRGWSEVEVRAALGENLLRVLRVVESVRRNTRKHTSNVSDITSNMVQITAAFCWHIFALNGKLH